MSPEGITRRQVLGWMAAVPAVLAVRTQHRPWHKPKPPPSYTPQPVSGALNAVPGYGQVGGFWVGGPL